MQRYVYTGLLKQLIDLYLTHQRQTFIRSWFPNFNGFSFSVKIGFRVKLRNVVLKTFEFRHIVESHQHVYSAWLSVTPLSSMSGSMEKNMADSHTIPQLLVFLRKHFSQLKVKKKPDFLLLTARCHQICLISRFIRRLDISKVIKSWHTWKTTKRELHYSRTLLCSSRDFAKVILRVSA